MYNKLEILHIEKVLSHIFQYSLQKAEILPSAPRNKHQNIACFGHAQTVNMFLMGENAQLSCEKRKNHGVSAGPVRVHG